jgi:NhaP-type Na+/H+ or K+/H+ antiporter
MPIDVEGTVEVLAWMLFGAALLGMVAWRVRLPYAVALVLAGVLVEETHLLNLPQLEPRVLLFVFLPPLLFDAAFRLDERELRAVARPVLLLAVPGTIATALVVAGVMVIALQLLDRGRAAVRQHRVGDGPDCGRRRVSQPQGAGAALCARRG